MNFAILHQKVSDGDLSKDTLRFLLNARLECEMLDYKVDLSLEDDKTLCNFTKDVLAIRNIGGGFIVIGVEDKTWILKGLTEPLPYDTKQLRDKVRKASGAEIEIDIVHHEIELPQRLAWFGLIHIRSTSKVNKLKRKPIIVQKDYCQHEKYGLRKGDIYIRNGDSTERLTSPDQLVELVENLKSKVEQHAVEASNPVSPFAVKNGLYRLLDKGYERFIGRENLRRTVLESVSRDPRMWIINVHGPGGVGKSALVNWATYQLYDERRFESIIQLTAKETLLDETGIKRYMGRNLYSLENLLEHIITTFEEEPPEDVEAQKVLATEILSAWSTLLILDNMETVQDGRILDFVQKLPPETKAKVLLTSRTKTGGWEIAISVNELKEDEVKEYLSVKSHEMAIDFPINGDRGYVNRCVKRFRRLPPVVEVAAAG